MVGDLKNNMIDSYIGSKKVASTKVMDEKTPAGFEIIEVHYEDLSIEHIAKVMYDKVVSNEPCNESILRDKRVQPVIETILSILREWGIKVGELQYMSAMLNRSLDYSNNQALIELMSQWMQRPLSLDDVD